MSNRWRSLSRQLRKERGSKCQECGVLEDRSRPQGLLHCHHILKWKTHKRLRFDSFYIIVLCQKCHIKYEEISANTEVLFMINPYTEGGQATASLPRVIKGVRFA